MKYINLGFHTARGEAHGKAILVGEHAVVYGAEALAIPVKSLWFAVHLEEGPATKFIVSGQDCTKELGSVLEEAQVMFDLQDLRFQVRAETNIPIRAGLGSSAALSVSVLRALGESVKRPLENKELARHGNILEAKFHGTPSGLDSAVVAYDSPLLFRKGEGAFPLNLAEPFAGKLYLIDSGEQASTREMVEKARPYFTSSDGPKIINEFNALTRSASYGLQSSNIDAVAKAMRGANIHLASAGLVSQRQAQMIDICLDSGALAAKITGAGGGGFIVALYPENWTGIKKLETIFESKVIEVFL